MAAILTSVDSGAVLTETQWGDPVQTGLRQPIHGDKSWQCQFHCDNSCQHHTLSWTPAKLSTCVVHIIKVFIFICLQPKLRFTRCAYHVECAHMFQKRLHQSALVLLYLCLYVQHFSASVPCASMFHFSCRPSLCCIALAHLCHLSAHVFVSRVVSQ